MSLPRPCTLISLRQSLAHAQLGNDVAKLYHAVLNDTARSSRDQACQRASLAKTLVQAGDLDQAISHDLSTV